MGLFYLQHTVYIAARVVSFESMEFTGDLIFEILIDSVSWPT